MNKLYAFILTFLLISYPSQACLRPIKDVVMPPKDLKKLHDQTKAGK